MNTLLTQVEFLYFERLNRLEFAGKLKVNINPDR